ncbi:MAG: hypothetical protein ACXABV_04610 [Candidatus Thorarchaeota archaeon]|jgi:hypothetical protein
MAEKIPKRTLPEIRISNEQTEDLKAIASIAKLFADDPKLAKSVAGAFVETSRAAPHEAMVAQMELREKVGGIVAEKLKDIPVDQILKLFPHWGPIIIRYSIPPPMWWIPPIWWQVWGPYGSELGR